MTYSAPFHHRETQSNMEIVRNSEIRRSPGSGLLYVCPLVVMISPHPIPIYLPPEYLLPVVVLRVAIIFAITVYPRRCHVIHWAYGPWSRSNRSLGTPTLPPDPNPIILSRQIGSWSWSCLWHWHIGLRLDSFNLAKIVWNMTTLYFLLVSNNCRHDKKEWGFLDSLSLRPWI